MKAFSALYQALDASTATRDKLDALKRHLARAEARDAAWAVYLLAGGRPRRAVPTAELRALACRIAGLPDWLFEAGYAATGDLAEAIAYVLPAPGQQHGGSLADWMEQRIARCASCRRPNGPRRCARPGTGCRPTSASSSSSWWAGLPGGREPGPGAARAGRAARPAARPGGAAHDGLHRRPAPAQRRGLPGPCRARGPGRQRPAWRPALPLLPGPAAGRWARGPGRARRLVGRVEVRRHPGPGGQAREPGLDLVARRGAGERALPRGAGRRPALARRHGGRWRAAGLARGRGRPRALRPAAKAHRPHPAGPGHPGRGPGAPAGLRPAGGRRPGPAGQPRTRAAPGWRPWASRPARCWRRTTGPAWPPCAPRPGPTGWRA
jgi:hypothetical protein